jgi:hypothetical protein
VARRVQPGWRFAGALALGVSACGGSPAPAGDRPDAKASAAGAAARPAYARPPDPCAAASAALKQRLGLRDPTPHVYERFQLDGSRPKDPIVAYDDVVCEWVVLNPPRSDDGRPNQMTASVSFAVIDPRHPSAGQVAAAVLTAGRERLDKDPYVEVVRKTGSPVDGHDGYYVYTRRRSATGESAGVEGAVHLANAVVVVRFSGADLRLDPSKPAGLQQVTEPVAESRLRPTVASLLPAAVGHLTRGGGR